MNTAKFRGQILDGPRKGEWVYGYYYMKYLTREKIQGIHYIMDVEGDVHIVDPKTVGQYIGQQDKNDREIYNDDLYIYSWDNEKYWIDKVKPDTGSGNHSVGFWTGWELREAPRHIEVVGNLHDTPNLLPKNHVNWIKSEYNPNLLTQ